MGIFKYLFHCYVTNMDTSMAIAKKNALLLQVQRDFHGPFW